MVIHLFPKSQFVEGFSAFLEQCFNLQEHQIILYTNKKFELPKYLYRKEFIEDYDEKNILWLYHVLRKARKIVFHNLSVPFEVMNLFYFFPSLSKKSVWLIWGSDLYCYQVEKHALADKYVEHMRERIIYYIPEIASLTEGDYELARKWYNTEAKNVRVNYCDINEINIIKEVMKEKKIKHNMINILIGNSATRSNCHIEVFDILEKFKCENIKLIVPISYGDMEYAEEIKKYGTNIYGDKISFIEKYMERDEYFRILSNVDIAIFNNNRQQALGNIFALIFMGKKIYLRKQTAMWKELVEKESYQLEEVDQIKSESWDEFIKRDETKIVMNHKFVDSFYDSSNRAIEWERIF